MLTAARRTDRATRVTLVDVAKDAGVSRATASLVVRNSPLVTDETRDKVLAAMDRLHYVYNRAAATLRSQRSHTIGLVIPDITNPFFAEMTLGCESYLQEQDYTFLLANSAENLDKQVRLLDAMYEHAVDGVLLCPATGTRPQDIERMRHSRLPFVLTVRYVPDTAADYVGADNAAGAEAAVEHLITLGHKRIAFIGGASASSARYDRWRGYQQALEKHDLPVDPALSFIGPVTRDGGKRGLVQLLGMPNPPTAALCYNDVVALGVMIGLQSAGRTPGVDFSVIGFDDIEEAALWQPPLTTVAIDPQGIGAAAAQLLINRINDPNGENQRVILEPRLMVRSSCSREGLPAHPASRAA
jgi:LacI family transcriptional regulator